MSEETPQENTQAPGVRGTEISLPAGSISLSKEAEGFILGVLNDVYSVVSSDLSAAYEGLKKGLSVFRISNLKLLLRRSSEILMSSQEERVQIPARTSVEIIEGAEREDNPELREMWARLLATAATSKSQRRQEEIRSMASMLRLLSPLSAKILREIPRSYHQQRVLGIPVGDRYDRESGYTMVVEGAWYKGELSDGYQPTLVSHLVRQHAGGDDVDASNEVIRAIDLLDSIGLVEVFGVYRQARSPRHPSDTVFDGRGGVRLLGTGAQLLIACQSPHDSDTGSVAAAAAAAEEQGIGTQ